jgi:hypothetical protein
MVDHQDPGGRLPSRHFASLAQRFEEEAPVVIIAEDPPTPIAAGHDVIEGAWLSVSGSRKALPSIKDRLPEKP